MFLDRQVVEQAPEGAVVNFVEIEDGLVGKGVSGYQPQNVQYVQSQNPTASVFCPFTSVVNREYGESAVCLSILPIPCP